MTHPDLEREIEAILCDFATFTDTAATITELSALVQRKLEKARQAEVAHPIFADTIEKWRTDSELLAKVEAELMANRMIRIGVSAADDIFVRADNPLTAAHFAPTLVEALRKLVGEES